MSRGNRIRFVVVAAVSFLLILFAGVYYLVSTQMQPFSSTHSLIRCRLGTGYEGECKKDATLIAQGEDEGVQFSVHEDGSFTPLELEKMYNEGRRAIPTDRISIRNYSLKIQGNYIVLTGENQGTNLDVVQPNITKYTLRLGGPNGSATTFIIWKDPAEITRFLIFQ